MAIDNRLRKELEKIRLKYLEFEEKIHPFHSAKVCNYAIDVFTFLDRELMEKQGYKLENNAYLLIYHGALLHDIGKPGISMQEVFYSCKPLSEEAIKSIKEHPILGAELIRKLNKNDLYVQCLADIIQCHHESPDGSGYPYGLKAEQIPAEARIITACDKFDAMTTKHCNNEVKTPAIAIEELKSRAGDELDLLIVKTLENGIFTLGRMAYNTFYKSMMRICQENDEDHDFFS